MKATKIDKEKARKRRIRAKISGTAERPRLSVFSSNMHISGQIIDDEAGKTIVSASDTEKEAEKTKGTRTETAKSIGLLIAKKAKDKKIKKVIFDRNGKLYHGRVKAFADGAREGGLEF